MFLREKKVKRNNKNYTYLLLVENYKIKGRVKQKELVNFGNIDNWSPERFSKLANDLKCYAGISSINGDDVDPRAVFDYGPHLLLDLLWKRFEFDQFWHRYLQTRSIEFEVEMALKTMVCNRWSEPKSKLAMDTEWVSQQYIPGVEPHSIQLHHYYRALDVIEEAKDRLEQWIFWRITNLFNYDLSLVFYDLTSSYFEGEGPCLAKQGYSREHRPDLKQIQIGLLVNPEGVPISHIVIDGSISDQKSLPDIIKTMTERFNLKRCIFVADDGILNGATVRQLQDANYRVIFSTSMHKEGWVNKIMEKLPPTTSADWKGIKDNLFIYSYPEDVDSYRVVVTFNPHRAKADKEKREKKIGEALVYLNTFNQHTKRGARKNHETVKQQINRYLEKKHLKKFFKFTRNAPYDLQYEVIDSVVKEQERKDGLMILRSDDRELSVEEIAIGYRTLSQVEKAFKEIKHFIKLRPIRHHNNERVKGHVAICVHAYLLEIILENSLRQNGLKLSARKAISRLKPLKAVENYIEGHRILKTIPPTEEQLKILKIAGLNKFERNLCN